VSKLQKELQQEKGAVTELMSKLETALQDKYDIVVVLANNCMAVESDVLIGP